MVRSLSVFAEGLHPRSSAVLGKGNSGACGDGQLVGAASYKPKGLPAGWLGSARDMACGSVVARQITGADWNFSESLVPAVPSGHQAWGS